LDDVYIFNCKLEVEYQTPDVAARNIQKFRNIGSDTTKKYRLKIEDIIQ
jgi:hypothetical protein